MVKVIRVVVLNGNLLNNLMEIITKEQCAEEADKYKNKSEFCKHNGKLYKISKENKWLDEFYPNAKKSNGYWTRERILEEAKKYNNLNEFTRKANGAYSAAQKLGIIYEIRNILPFHFQPSGYWNYERCLEESKKYTTLIDFHDNSSGAYRASVTNGWITNFNLVSTRKENYGKTYTIEELNELTKECYNKAEFKKKYFHAYKFARINGLLNNLTYTGPTWSINDNGDREWKNCDDKQIFVNPDSCKYTYNKLYEIAKKYDKLNDFRLQEPSAYATANYRGWIKDYTWIERDKHFYDETECYEIAKKCKTKTEFYKTNLGAYTFSLKHGLLETYNWFIETNSTLELDIEDFLILNGIIYEKQKRFDWLHYKKKQSLDFYLPEYNIAIECQGIQHFKDVKYFKQCERITPIKALDKNKKELCDKHGLKILYYSNLGIDYPYKVYENKDELLKAILDETSK